MAAIMRRQHRRLQGRRRLGCTGRPPQGLQIPARQVQNVAERGNPRPATIRRSAPKTAAAVSTSIGAGAPLIQAQVSSQARARRDNSLADLVGAQPAAMSNNAVMTIARSNRISPLGPDGGAAGGRAKPRW